MRHETAKTKIAKSMLSNRIEEIIVPVLGRLALWLPAKLKSLVSHSEFLSRVFPMILGSRARSAGRIPATAIEAERLSFRCPSHLFERGLGSLCVGVFPFLR